MPPAVPPVPEHELAQLIGSMRPPSIGTQEIEEERFVRRIRNSRRILFGNMAAIASQRRRIAPSNESSDEMVDMARGRQHRVTSVPDQRAVEQVRQEERERGGPSAPRNSIDLSATDVNETIDVNDESDADDVSIDELYSLLGESVVFQGVPPLIPSPTTNVAFEGDEPVTNSLDMTIDLTESPVRPTSIPTPIISPPMSQRNVDSIPTPTVPPLKSQCVAAPSSSVSSPKCPVCLDSFSSIHRRGNRLVSTLCGHVFCGRCLPACVRTSGHCPTCRTRIGYEDFHPLFLF